MRGVCCVYRTHYCFLIIRKIDGNKEQMTNPADPCIVSDSGRGMRKEREPLATRKWENINSAPIRLH